MDVEYLLYLQGLRESWGSGAESFITLVTKIPASPLSAIIPGVLFWCINRRAGLFLLCVMAFGRLVNKLIKGTLCVYRPWILDSEIKPIAEALSETSSYSMPSGHTQFTTAIYGGLAYFYRKKYRLLIIPCALVILAVGFSRNFLGVHTPQDILVAILETVAVMFVVEKIFNEVERDRNFAQTAFVGGVILCVVSAVYLLAKSYPIDYIGGQVIVSPESARLDVIDGIGLTVGFLVSVALERRFVNFSTNVDLGVKIRRVIIGGVVGGVAMIFMYSFKLIGLQVIYLFLKGFMPMFAVIFLAPYAFNYLETKTHLRFKKLGR